MVFIDKIKGKIYKVTMISYLTFAANGPPTILEPLVPSFRTTRATYTATYIPLSTLTSHFNSITVSENLDSKTSNILCGNDTVSTQQNLTSSIPTREPRYSLSSMILMGVIAGILSLLTVIGNVMVMISFKIDKQLQTISNYFLFSLAIADFAIGLISMPLFAVSTIVGYWPLGPHICDTWLALDYLASNASVLNLLIISFDRYFSVTRPLTYRAKRTTNRAAVMIAAAWGISLILWPPWIYSWPYIEGKRTVPQDECYIQFIETNQYITFLTALAAFYFPVTIMCFLYYRIWKETKKRQKDLPNLQAGKKDSSKRSNISGENNIYNQTGILSISHLGQNIQDHGIWKRPRFEPCADVESAYIPSIIVDSICHGITSQKSSVKTKRSEMKKYQCFGSIKAWCIAWWQSGHEDSDEYSYDQDEPSFIGDQSNMMLDTYSLGGSLRGVKLPSILLSNMSPIPMKLPLTPPSNIDDLASGAETQDTRALYNKIITRSLSQESVYTVLIRLPPDSGNTPTAVEVTPSIKMIHEDFSAVADDLLPCESQRPRYVEQNLPFEHRMPHTFADGKIPLNTKIISKRFSKSAHAGRKNNALKKKKKSQEKRQESKAAKTLSAILLSFILTWTPYNILVLIKPLTTCSDCIPNELWEFFYALCYINSTINPVCYALCNASFRRTYIRILSCKWHSRNREGMVRGVYN